MLSGGGDFRPQPLLRALAVDFVVIGDVAGGLAEALRKLGATLRGAPVEIPFRLDAATLKAAAHFTFATPLGSSSPRRLLISSDASARDSDQRSPNRSQSARAIA